MYKADPEPLELYLSNLNLTEKITGVTAQETAYLTLRKAAMIGALEPGEPLTIRGIADALGMSTTPVREALRRLCSERALTLLQNRRVIIPPMRKERFDELIELRIMLETFAAKRALPFISDRRITELEKLDMEADAAISSNEHEKTVIANQRFHETLYRTNPEQEVMPMVESIWLQLGPFLKIAAIRASEPAVDHHKLAIEALRDRNAQKLVKAIELDIRKGLPASSQMVFQPSE